MILGAKLQRLRGWKVGKLGDMLDPIESNQIHGSKSTKYHHTNKSQKNNWGYFCGEFLNLGQHQQNEARKQRWEAPKL